MNFGSNQARPMSLFHEDIRITNWVVFAGFLWLKVVLIPQGQMKILDAIYLQAALVTLSFNSLKKFLIISFHFLWMHESMIIFRKPKAFMNLTSCTAQQKIKYFLALLLGIDKI